MKPQPRGEPNLAIRALADGSVELDIFDGIGEWFGGVTTKGVAALLKEHAGKPLTVRINSPGGDAFDGAGIYNLLKQHAGPVSVMVLGVAASAASVIAMAGAPILMAENAIMMIHEPWNMAVGDAEAMRQAAEALDADAKGLAKTYARRTGKGVDEIRSLMKKETWMTSDEAIAMGFADETIESAMPVAACIRDEHLKLYRTLPEHAKAFVAGVDVTADLQRVLRPGDAVALERNPETHVVRLDATPSAAAVPPPNSPATAPAQPAEEANPHTENPMPFSKSILAILCLAETATDVEVESAVKKLHASAKVGAEVEQLLGQSGAAAVGAVRALKETADSHDELEADIERLKVHNDRRDFEASLATAMKGPKRKLTPAQAKFWRDKFEAAVKTESTADAVAELNGFLAASPTLGSGSASVQPSGAGGGATAEGAGVLTHNGKNYTQLKGGELHQLKKSDPDLFEALRASAVEHGLIAA